MATRSVSPALHRYEPVRERGTLRAFGLAVLTHLLLIAFLYFGVQWQSSTPRGEEAELWDEAAVQQAVQTAPPPPEVKPEPVIKAPPTKVEEEADIALEQKRKREREAAASAAREAELARRAAEDRAEAQRQAQLKAQKEQQARQAELQRKAQAEQQAKEKAAAAEAQARKNAQLQAQAEAKAKADAEAKQKELKAKAAADAKAKADAERKANESRANAQRKEQLDRLRAMAGAAGATGTVAGSGGGVGNAMGTGGTSSAGYAERVRAKVQPNIHFYDDTTGTPIVTVLVEMAPDGTVLSRSVKKTSGYPALDEAVLRAVDASSPLPRDTNGNAPSSVIVGFKPKKG